MLRTLGVSVAGSLGAGAAYGQPREHENGPSERGPGAGSLRIVQTRNGPFFVDQHGRTVILHGVNVGKKTPPFIRPDESFDKTDVERIRSWGFNLVRLGVIWEGIAPERGTLDDAYLDRVRELVRLFADHDIHVLIDMHQDLYSREFGGDGAPSWAVYTDGIPFTKSSPWQLDYADPAVARAYDHFWLDDHDLQTAYTEAFTAVARRVADVDGLVGYELFNEPSPGARTAAGFSERYLPQFYERVAAGLRAVDASTPIWVEPEGLTNAGKPATLGQMDIDQLAYSFHNYADLPFDVIEQRGDRSDTVGYQNQEWVMANNHTRAEQLGAVPILSEFCPGNDTADTAHLADLADEYMTGWAYWSYDNWGTRTSGAAGTMVGHSAVVDTLVRPYPPAIAGVPRSYGFDRESGTFTLRYTPSREATRPTVVFVPEHRYPNGYEVAVDGGQAIGSPGQYLRVRHHQRAMEVRVTVSPQ